MKNVLPHVALARVKHVRAQYFGGKFSNIFWNMQDMPYPFYKKTVFYTKKGLFKTHILTKNRRQLSLTKHTKEYGFYYKLNKKQERSDGIPSLLFMSISILLPQVVRHLLLRKTTYIYVLNCAANCFKIVF